MAEGRTMTTIRRYSIRISILCALLLACVAFGYRSIYEEPKERALIASFQTRELESIEHGFTFLSKAVENIVVDWAYWNDTYEFITAPKDHPSYISANISRTTFRNLRLVGIQYINNSFDILYEQGFDLGSSSYIDFGDLRFDTKAHLGALGRKAEGEDLFRSVSWVRTASGPALVVISSITNSQQDAKPGGYLVFIRLIAQQDLDQLAAVTRLTTRFESLESHSDADPLSVPVNAEAVQSTRVRLLMDPLRGESVAALAIKHNADYSSQLLNPGSLLLLFGLGLVPFLSFRMLDYRLVVPLEQSTRRIENMVGSDRLFVLEAPFSLKELEDMRLAFNGAVHSVERQQQQLRQLVVTDGLTGIANRRGFDLHVERVSQEARRLGVSMMWLVLDLDHFKQFNDQFGHVAGDEALRRVGGALQRLTKRATDFCARIGGEEFAVISVAESEDAARHHAQSICVAIANLGIAHPGSATAPHLTVSIGGLWIPDMSNVPASLERDHLFALADKALYQAKAAGRNRCCIEDMRPQEADSVEE
jgi:diguanylate cyclase (GGDEF)-like protein